MAAEPKLKLLIDGNTKKVLFGEANKELVDFLFGILALPVGRVTELLKENRMVGSIGSLYKSLKDMPEECIQPNTDRNLYLKPKLSIPATPPAAALLLGLQEEPVPAPFPRTTPVFHSASAPSSTPAFHSASAPSSTPAFYSPATPAFHSASAPSSTPAFYSPATPAFHSASALKFPTSSIMMSISSGGGQGCVKGAMKYMVMDNLEVTPMSAISSITLLNKFHVKDVAALVEKEVEVGMKEGLALLKASFESKTVLTDVFREKPTSSQTPISSPCENLRL